MTGWQTAIQGNMYRLTDTGTLERMESRMSNTHIQRMAGHRHRDACTAVAEELEALAARRAEQHAKEQPR